MVIDPPQSQTVLVVGGGIGDGAMIEAACKYDAIDLDETERPFDNTAGAVFPVSHAIGLCVDNNWLT